MTFKVTYDGGAVVEAVAKPKDFVAFERQYGQSMASFDPESGVTPPLEWLFYLAWSPLHRQQREPEAFDGFLDKVDDIEVVDTDAADPTQPAASDVPLPG